MSNEQTKPWSPREIHEFQRMVNEQPKLIGEPIAFRYSKPHITHWIRTGRKQYNYSNAWYIRWFILPYWKLYFRLFMPGLRRLKANKSPILA
jgi:hypothetical protein